MHFADDSKVGRKAVGRMSHSVSPLPYPHGNRRPTIRLAELTWHFECQKWARCLVSDPAIVWADDRNHLIASWQNLITVLWRGEHTLQNAEVELPAVARHVRDAWGKKAVILVIHDKYASLPTRNARRRTIRAMRTAEDLCSVYALVSEGNRRRAVVARLIGMVMGALTSGKTKFGSFTKCSDALGWLARQAAQDGNSFDAQMAVHAMTAFLQWA